MADEELFEDPCMSSNTVNQTRVKKSPRGIGKFPAELKIKILQYALVSEELLSPDLPRFCNQK